jgi:hypothetical protein
MPESLDASRFAEAAIDVPQSPTLARGFDPAARGRDRGVVGEVPIPPLAVEIGA